MVEPTDRQFGLEMLRRQQARESLISFSQSMELPGVPLSATLDAEDPATRRLVDPVERVRWAFKPIETRVALHHALTMAVMQRAMLKPRGRAMIFEPPGAAKSTYACAASAWYMGKFPDSAIIYTSYASPIAAKQSRRVRAICRDVDYSAIWPEHPLLLDDQRAIDDWSLTNGSSFLSAGLLAGITGNRADGLMIDDPVQNREQADSSTIRTKTYEEFVDTATTRAKPSMWIILIQCMVGATRVTMADGTEKALRDIRPGDIVASYENGRLIPARILRWRNNGLDRVFTIKTKSGNIATANGRHPFLVHQSGKYVWVRLRDLKPGYHMVIASTTELAALMTGAPNPQSAKGFAQATTTSPDGAMAFDRLRVISARAETRTSNIGMASRLTNTARYWLNKAACALFASSRRVRMFASIGRASFASITATSQEKYAGCCATTVISLSATENQKASCALLPITSEITEILASGTEDVFDVQVERTENFIANGFVSHNTRWHEDDLAGSILPAGYAGESGLILCRDGNWWEVLCIPAEAERADDPLGRKAGEFLWPEYFPTEHWLQWRNNPRARRTWSALYQQRPAPDIGIQFNRAILEAAMYNPHMARGDEDALPKDLRFYGASDYATLSDRGDFTEHGVFGMDTKGDLWAADWWSGQKETDVTIDAFIAKVGIWKPAKWANEGGLIDKAIGPAIRRRMRETQKYVAIEVLPSIQNKETKLQSFHARAMAGSVHLPRNDWGYAVLDQLVGFPGAKFDDKADVCGLIGRMIDQMVEAHETVAPSKPLLIPYSAAWVEWKGGSDKAKVRYTSNG
jgi:predicted phage terminase large subunit-like protein